MEGTVKWYDDFKSYGFIQVEMSKDVFVHRNALPIGTTLKEGDRVKFDLQKTTKGQRAINVEKL
jgi:CspA family cold shock protein